MNKKRLLLSYLTFDIISVGISWFVFFTYRKYHVDPQLFEHFQESILGDFKLHLGWIIFPVYWLGLHFFSGYYRRVYKKSRLKELGQTLAVVFLGSVVLFLAIILDDEILTVTDYYRYFTVLFGAQFLTTYIPRLLLTTSVAKKIHSGKYTFSSIIIGSGQTALNTYQMIKAQNVKSGNHFIGFIDVESEDSRVLEQELPCLGGLEALKNYLDNNAIEELIVAVQNGTMKHLESIFSMLEKSNVVLKIIPQTQDYILGTVKTTSVLYEPLIEIHTEYLSEWQIYLKRSFDILLSALTLLILSPLYLILAIGVKRSSKGSVFYAQERIGLHGKPFKIYKFRSMYENAEARGPQLSSKNDPRVTPFGLLMRKSRLDELPQFYNVLIGNMSIVGYRPERQFYIDQIIKIAPHYKLLLRIKPGITSWGQVKFGYAENVEEMVQRLKWDLLYLENMSLQMDIKILIYTVLIVLKRTGK